MAVRIHIETIPPDEPHYSIGAAARLVNLHPQTLRHYEALGLVVPQRSRGNIRFYSPRDIERLRKISRLTQELGVNLASVKIILRLSEQVEALRAELTRKKNLHQIRFGAQGVMVHPARHHSKKRESHICSVGEICMSWPNTAVRTRC